MNVQTEIFHNLVKVDWKNELLYIPFAPKNPISSFSASEAKVFVSAMRPLLIVSNLANEQETEMAFRAQN